MRNSIKAESRFIRRLARCARAVLACVCLAVLSSARAEASAGVYSPGWIMEPQGAPGIVAKGINNAGQVVGSGQSDAYWGTFFEFRGGIPGAYGAGIDERGIVYGSVAQNGLNRPALIQSGDPPQVTFLPFPGVSPGSQGWVLGSHPTQGYVGTVWDQPEYFAVWWQPSPDGSHRIRRLNAPPGAVECQAVALNGQGTVVGNAWYPDGSVRTVVWNQEPKLLDPTGSSSFSQGINEAGQVVGWRTDASGASRPTLWENGLSLDLGLPPGFSGGFATAINRSGTVVGLVWGAPGYRAFVWTAEKGIHELTALLHAESGWSLFDAVAINDEGVVVGTGYSVPLGRQAQYSLMLAGSLGNDLIEAGPGTTSTGAAPAVPMTASAGPDRTVTIAHDGSAATNSASFTLDGSASTSPDGSPISLRWWSNGNLVADAPTVTVQRAPGVYTFLLYAFAENRTWVADSVTVTVVPEPNRAPVASVGAGEHLAVAHDGRPDTNTASFRLDGGFSSDPGGDALTYRWYQGTTLVASTAVPTLGRPAGTYAFRLMVSDPYGAASEAFVTMIVDPEPNQAPVVKSTSATSPTAGTVRLTGVAGDPDFDSLQFSWSVGSKLLGTAAAVQAQLPSGSYTFTFRATDPYGATSTGTVTATVQ